MMSTEIPREQLVQWVVDWHEEKVDDDKLIQMVHTFGSLDFFEAHALVEQCIKHSNPNLRYAALETLAGRWRLGAHWFTATQFLQYDSDSDCRRIGASVLGLLRRNSNDSETLQLLAHTVCNPDEEDLVRETAYASMLEVIDYDIEQQATLLFNTSSLEEKVNWRLVHRYLDE